ncbi:MAG: zinc ribbon domain-containing protein [Fidelibacterota bacterium]
MKTFIFLPLLTIVSLLQASDVEELNIVVYPEYYYPGVMVEYAGTFVAQEANATYSFMVPSNADSIFLILDESDRANNMESLPAEDRNGESWVTVHTDKKEFHVFVFFMPFNPHEEERDFSFSFKVNNTPAKTHFLVQEPSASQNFEIDQEGFETISDQHGMKFYRYHVHDLAPGKPFTVRVRYRNPTNETSMEILKRMLSEGGTQQQTPSNAKEAPQRHHLPIWEPLIVLFVVFLAIAIVFIRNYNQSGAVSRATTPTGKNFCPQCGTAVQASAKFCHQCGTKL